MAGTGDRSVRRSPASPQAGAALITSMILLLILTIVAVSSMGTTAMQERMARNLHDRDVAFQAAEAALRAAERVIEARTDIPDLVFDNGGVDDDDPTANNDGDSCLGGFCIPKEHDAAYAGGGALPVDRWAVGAGLDVWSDPDRHMTYGYAGNLQLPADPMFIIEFLGYRIPDDESSSCGGPVGGPPNAPNDTWPFCPSDPQHYRVTALGFGGTGEARVMLQSTYLKSP